MNEIKEYLPIILPIIVIHWTMAIVALVHIFKHKNYKFGNRVIWCLVVMFIQIFGSILYFLFGRSDE